MESTIGGWVRSKLRVFEPRSDPCGVLGLRTDQGQGPAVSLRPRDPWRRSKFVFQEFRCYRCLVRKRIDFRLHGDPCLVTVQEVDRPSSVILAEFCAAPGGSESGV